MGDLELKNTKDIENFREAIKAQDLNIDYFIETAESIARELRKDHPHRSYVYEKINVLAKLKEY